MLLALSKTSLTAFTVALTIVPGSISISSLGAQISRDGSVGDTDLAVVKQKFDDANVCLVFFVWFIGRTTYITEWTVQIPTDISMNFDPSVLLEVIFPQLDESTINVAAGVQLSRNGQYFLALFILGVDFHCRSQRPLFHPTSVLSPTQTTLTPPDHSSSR